MKKSKAPWTPGPWRVEMAHNGAFVISDAKNNWGVCSRSYWPNRVEQSEANARLIAAAPDMADAILAYIEAVDAVMEDPEKTPLDLRPHEQAFRAAIAKARGES